MEKDLVAREPTFQVPRLKASWFKELAF